jgi:prophage regulatory protein
MGGRVDGLHRDLLQGLTNLQTPHSSLSNLRNTASTRRSDLITKVDAVPDALELLANSIHALAAALRQADPVVIPARVERNQAESRREALPMPKQVAAESNLEQTKRLMRLREVIACTGLSRSTIYRYVSEHRFPAPVRLDSAYAVRWVSVEVDDWISRQISLRDNERVSKR